MQLTAIGLDSLNSNSETHMTAICDARLIYGRGRISPVFKVLTFKVGRPIASIHVTIGCSGYIHGMLNILSVVFFTHISLLKFNSVSGSLRNQDNIIRPVDCVLLVIFSPQQNLWRLDFILLMYTLHVFVISIYLLLLLYHFIHTLYIYIKNKYTGIVFWSIFTVYLRNLHIHIHHLPDLKE